MSKVSLILCLHAHQPVGNFDHVVDEAYRRSYRPLLEELDEQGQLVVLHYSGWLLQRLLKEHPDYGERLKGMVADGRLELLSGGFYEPILCSIPEADKVWQILRLTDFLREHLGADAQGIWLTERVWEPGLVGPLAAAGVRHLVTDDTHFLAAGLREEELTGYRLTEDAGEVLAVFPGSKELRYRMPFQAPERTLELLAELRDRPDRPDRPMLCLADDAEKFGVWPGTYESVYRQGWLKRFFQLVRENSDWLELTTFARYRQEVSPEGRVYLPTASYEEMMEWSLPSPAQELLEDARHHFDGDSGLGRYRMFLRGGFWRGFLTKYEEVNWMHKRALLARRSVADRWPVPPEAGVGREAWEHLWAAQCNDAYWHGVFGGIYAPNLRFETYRNLLAAERLSRQESPPVRAVEQDLDCDGAAEVTLEAADLRAFVSPGRGGVVRELDWLPGDVNLVNSMARRREAYHRRLQQAARPDQQDGGTIHDRVVAKEEGLERLLMEDRFGRDLLVDHLLPAGIGPRLFRRGEFEPLAALAGEAYRGSPAVDGDRARLELEHRTGLAGGELVLAKRLELGADGFAASYRLELPDGTPPARLAVELCLNLLAPDAPDRFVDCAGQQSRLGAERLWKEQEAVRVVDRWLGVAVELVFEPVPAELWWLPVETVSLSEEGFERVYQGSALVPVWDLADLGPEPFRGEIRLGVGPA